MTKRREPAIEMRLPDPDLGPPPLPPGFPRWKYFAWDHWQVEIPVDWDLGALETGPKGGYFRLDDEFEPRLMVRWQPLAGNFDPEKAIQRHFKKNYPVLAKSDTKVRPKIGASLPGLRKAFKGLTYETYSLTFDEHRSVGLAAHCPKCARAFVAEMNTTQEGGAGERLIKRVLGSFHDHPGGKLARWEAFGLSLDLPESLRAVNHRFNQGYVSISAAEPNRRVDVSRWTLANMHLAKVDLQKFLNFHLLRKRDMPPITTSDAVVQSHKAVLFHTKRRLLEPARKVLRKALRFKQPAYRTGLIWHCTRSNRIILFQLGSAKPADVGAARLLASRVRCCKVMH
jgi:hypothetical protein